MHQFQHPSGYVIHLSLITCAILAILPLSSGAATLEYHGRYNHQPGPDHLMDVLTVSGDRAIVAGNQGLALLDLNNLPPGGTQNYLDRLTGLNGRDMVIKDDTYIYVNLNGPRAAASYGFAVVELSGNSLTHRGTVNETGVFYEKLCLDGNYLYVPAHDDGIRIFSVTLPLGPVEVGRLEDGFTDAFAIHVEGDTAYVADGGGGLKIIDVTDPTTPVLLEGENTTSAAGTAQDVTWRNGHLYAAVCGAGVTFYANADLAQRTIYPVDGGAKDLLWVGDRLAVSDMSGVTLFDVAPDGSLSQVGSESAQRRGLNAELRLWSGMAVDDAGRLLCANWNHLDHYAVREPGAGSQPDITASTQRIRFLPRGGTAEVTITNQGAGSLVINAVTPSLAAFSCNYSGGTLAPNESVLVEISYNGTGTSVEENVFFESNDPDENPLPIQVFGRTTYIDPGEPSTDFTLPILRKDPGGGYIEESFTLSQHLGKVVWFQIYGSW